MMVAMVSELWGRSKGEVAHVVVAVGLVERFAVLGKKVSCLLGWLATGRGGANRDMLQNVYGYNCSNDDSKKQP